MDARIVFISAVMGIVHCHLIDTCNYTKIFVNGHNARRLKLAIGDLSGQPAASRMTYLIWDKELATKASNWASKNQYGHNPNRTIPSGRFTVGENIYRYGTTNKKYEFDPEQAMDYWWDEHKDFTYHALSLTDFTSSKQVGHYTQMAWADTKRLGCGISKYFEKKWTFFYVVCNYGPGGNYMSQPPYDKNDGPSGRLVCGESDCSQKYGDKC